MIALLTAQELMARLQPEGGAGTGGDAPLCIVDARSPRRYKTGHIPGAVNLPLSSLFTFDGPVQALVGPDEFAQKAGAAGICKDVSVVFCGERGGMEAAYAAWACEYYGHPRVAFLNGGMEAWQAAGGPLSLDEPAVEPCVFIPEIRPDIRAGVDEILAALGRPDVQIVDTRMPAEYAGRLPVAKRNGHIPGAVRVDWERAMEQDYTFKDPDAIAAFLAEYGLDPGKESILYCQAGPRAAHLYLAMKSAGFASVKVYDRSWSEWGNREDTPVEV